MKKKYCRQIIGIVGILFTFLACGVENNSNKYNVKLNNTKWIDNECRYTSIYDEYGNIISKTGFNKIIYLFKSSDIKKEYQEYSDENCTIFIDSYEDNIGIKYKKLDNLKNVKGEKLYGIQIKIVDSSNGYDKILKHDGYYVFNSNKLCFSKSIFVNNKIVPIYDESGEQIIGEQILNGFAIVKDESDEIGYKHCLTH